MLKNTSVLEVPHSASSDMKCRILKANDGIDTSNTDDRNSEKFKVLPVRAVSRSSEDPVSQSA